MDLRAYFECNITNLWFCGGRSFSWIMNNSYTWVHNMWPIALNLTYNTVWVGGTKAMGMFLSLRSPARLRSNIPLQDVGQSSSYNSRSVSTTTFLSFELELSSVWRNSSECSAQTQGRCHSQNGGLCWSINNGTGQWGVHSLPDIPESWSWSPDLLCCSAVQLGTHTLLSSWYNPLEMDKVCTCCVSDRIWGFSGSACRQLYN